MKKPFLIGLYLLNLGVIIGFWLSSSGSLLTAGGKGLLLGTARLMGLLGMFSILTQYVLISDAPWVNRILGQYRLTGLHKHNGKLAFALILSHIVLVKSVYSMPLALPFVWLAAVAFAILVVTVTSAALQKYLPYRFWHTLHLLNYTIVALVIWHQLANGGDFLVNPYFRGYWIALSILTLANLLYFRVLKKHLRFSQ